MFAIYIHIFFFYHDLEHIAKYYFIFHVLSMRNDQTAVNRFATLFSHDSDSMPRVWTGKEDIRAITKTARSAV